MRIVAFHYKNKKQGWSRTPFTEHGHAFSLNRQKNTTLVQTYPNTNTTSGHLNTTAEHERPNTEHRTPNQGCPENLTTEH